MNAGMLWFDNDPKKPLTQKVIEAADYHAKKYGRVPNACFVNPSAISETTPSNISGIAIRPFRSILPGHLWIGIDNN